MGGSSEKQDPPGPGASLQGAPTLCGYWTMVFHHPTISGGESHCQLCWINKGKALKVMSQPIDCRAHLRVFHTTVISPHCPTAWRSISVISPDSPPARGRQNVRKWPCAFSPFRTAAAAVSPWKQRHEKLWVQSSHDCNKVFQENKSKQR